MFRRTPIPDYYSQKYYESSYNDLYNLAEHERKALVLLHAQINDIVLDIGCGRGTFLKEAARSSRLAVGVDYSKDAVRISPDFLCISLLIPPMLFHRK